MGQQTGAVRGRRRGALAALVVLLAVLASGCRAHLGVDVVVGPDGAGQLSVSLTADAALLAAAAGAGADPLGDVAAVGEQLAATGWRAVDATQPDGGRTVTLSAPFASPEEFDALAAELVEGLAAPELVPLDGLRLELTEEEIVVAGEAGLQPTEVVAELGLTPEEAVALLADGDHLRYTVAVHLPGEVLGATGAREGGAGPVTWDIAPGQRVELLAVGERPRSDWWVLALSGVLGGLLGVALLALGRRGHRRRGARRGTAPPRRVEPVG